MFVSSMVNIIDFLERDMKIQKLISEEVGGGEMGQGIFLKKNKRGGRLFGTLE